MKEILIDIKKCVGCKSCELACAVEHSMSKALFSAIMEHPLPKKRVFVEQEDGKKAPLQCRHCEDAPCTTVCVYGAMQYVKKTGLVVHNKDKCLGCFMCVMVCPFGIIDREEERKVAVKCDRCPDRDVPACVNACPTKAMVFTEIDTAEKTKRKRVLQTMLVEMTI